MPRKKVRKTSNEDSLGRQRPAPGGNPSPPNSDTSGEVKPPRGPAQSAAMRSNAQRQARRQSGQNSSRRIRIYVGAAAAALITLVVILVIVSTVGSSDPGQRVPDQGRRHLQIGETYDGYNSDPPTSGPHSPSWMPPGHYDAGAPDSRLIHSLEHGYVILHYTCHSTQCPDLVNRIARLGGRFETKFIANYRPSTTAPITMTAWTRLLELDEYDEAMVIQFIEAYRGKIGPERDVPN